MEPGGDEPLLRVGEAQAQQRAAAGSVLRRHAATVRLGDLAHDREAEPGPGQRSRRCRAVEAVEHVRVLSSGAMPGP